MRVLLQRVRHASVSVTGEEVSRIEDGLLVLLGVADSDGDEEIAKMAQKIVNLRIFNDEDGKFNRSLLDMGGQILVVSQFTLYADTRRGRRPSFTDAARPEKAEPLVERLAERLRNEGVKCVETGVFGANMDVTLCNQGPVTIWIDSEQMSRK
ncbi:MAG: D-aminoacyl-tRNA deacylase [Acidobacteriota bacterium]|nr:D-aminoacyl-tRNA deacylase [Acidobacteriota bacterium]